jgi:dihydrofolate reductase
MVPRGAAEGRVQMRKLVLGVGISLDGYIARKNGSVDWLSMDWDYDWKKFFETVDAVVMGRKTLEHALDAMALEGGPKNPYEGMETYVVSRTLETSPVGVVELVSGDIVTFIGNLKTREGRNIWVAGGGELARSLLEADLVDEISLGISPMLHGEGIPLFPEMMKEVPLRLVSSRVSRHLKEDNGLLELLYEVKK